jgi:FkbM family methyltransferase
MLIPYEYIHKILSDLNIKITGAFHIGAHDCEEIFFYKNLNLTCQDIIWVDALDFKVIQCKERGIPNVYNAVISDKDDENIIFHISNNIQSSSMLDLHTHSIEHPDVVYIYEFKTKTISINSFFEKNNIDNVIKYNFWNFDIQGAELLALKGADKYIKNVDAIYLEVNEKELYKNCGLIHEIDAFLSNYGFKREITVMTPHGWGDALYVKT